MELAPERMAASPATTCAHFTTDKSHLGESKATANSGPCRPMIAGGDCLTITGLVESFNKKRRADLHFPGRGAVPAVPSANGYTSLILNDVGDGQGQFIDPRPSKRWERRFHRPRWGGPTRA